MRISTTIDTIEKSEGLASRSFSLNFNEKIARMLSKGIYQNVIRAPIRELACNAIDSHRAAGKRDVPIRVHLPNNLEPYFEVQDEGVGLSDDGIYSLFTCYGGSDKDHNNEDIGGFGLGSKAPFAYTSSFNVTSVFAGVKRHYVMHKDELGKPHVTPMGEEATTDTNGVTVRVPVKPSDFNSFRENAQETFRWFDVPPTVSGNHNYKLPQLEIMQGFEYPMWSLIKTDDRGYYNSQRAMVLMANVAYPLRADSLNAKYHRLTQYPLIIRFNNGELEPAVSREDLNYDEHTVQVLEMRLDQVMRDLLKAVEDRISSATTMWQARVALLELTQDRATGDIMRTLQSSGYTAKWRGQDVQQDNYVYWGKEFNKENPAPNIQVVSETYRARSTTEVRVGKKVQFVLKDCSDATSRCREAFYKNSNNKNRVYLIEGVTLDPVHKDVVIWNATACDQVRKWLSFAGDPDTILASSLPKPEKKVMTFKGRVWTGRGINSYRPTKSANWKDEQTLTTTQGGYYVTLEGLTPWHKDLNDFDLNIVLEHARTLKILNSTDVIHGINKTNTKLIEKNTAWREVTTYVKAELIKLINAHKIEQLVQQRALLQEANLRVQYGDAKGWHARFGLMQNGLGAYVRQWYQLSQSQAKAVDVEAVRRLARVLKVEVTSTVTQTVNMDTEWTQIMTRYPLLRHAVRTYPEDLNFQDYVDYVNLVDTVNK